MVNPFALPLWLAGLGWLFFGRDGRRYRVLGWAYLVTLGVFMALHGKDYYVAPAYPVLLAAGGVVCEEWIERGRRVWLKPVFVLVLVVPALVFLPLIAPVVSPERFVAFIRAIHFTPPVSEHSHARSPLPQYYSDEFGWEAMVAQVAQIYHDLPPDVQARTAIKTSNYGEAGAIDYFGPKYGSASGDLLSSELLVLGDARLHGREHHRGERGKRGQASQADQRARRKGWALRISRTRWRTSTSGMPRGLR